MQQRFRFEFPETAEARAVEDDVALAIFTAECIHGRPQTRLEVGYLVAGDGRTCVVQVRGPAGESAARVFIGLCGALFGENGYTVEGAALDGEQ